MCGVLCFVLLVGCVRQRLLRDGLLMQHVRRVLCFGSTGNVTFAEVLKMLYPKCNADELQVWLSLFLSNYMHVYVLAERELLVSEAWNGTRSFFPASALAWSPALRCAHAVWPDLALAQLRALCLPCIEPGMCCVPCLPVYSA